MDLGNLGFVGQRRASHLSLPQMPAKDWDSWSSVLCSFPQEDVCHVRECQKIGF